MVLYIHKLIQSCYFDKITLVYQKKIRSAEASSLRPNVKLIWSLMDVVLANSLSRAVEKTP